MTAFIASHVAPFAAAYIWSALTFIWSVLTLRRARRRLREEREKLAEASTQLFIASGVAYSQAKRIRALQTELEHLRSMAHARLN